MNAPTLSPDLPPTALKFPKGLHPDTADLVVRFANALAAKLHKEKQ